MVTSGSQAPDFELESTSGRTVRLADERTNGPVVVLLFRGVWCSYCAEQLLTFSALAYDLRRHLDVRILPIAPEPVPELREMRDRFDLRFQLLSDPDCDVAAEYTGIEDNRRHGRIPIPGTIVVNPDGEVRYVDVATRPDDRTYANYVRSFVREGYEDPYPGEFPDPYTP